MEVLADTVEDGGVDVTGKIVMLPGFELVSIGGIMSLLAVLAVVVDEDKLVVVWVDVVDVVCLLPAQNFPNFTCVAPASINPQSATKHAVADERIPTLPTTSVQ